MEGHPIGDCDLHIGVAGEAATKDSLMVMADILSDHAKPRVFPEARDQHLRDMANCIRFLSTDDPGAPMGMADIALSAALRADLQRAGCGQRGGACWATQMRV
jgi:hypothetical protein